MDKLDFYGASLKFKAHPNTLPLERKLSSWDPSNNGICLLCKEGIEDVTHFMLKCKSFDNIRNMELTNLKNNLCMPGYGFIWNEFFSTSSVTSIKLSFILGSYAMNSISYLTIESMISLTCTASHISNMLGQSE